MKRELARRQIVLDKNAARDFVHLHPRCVKDFRDILEQKRRKNNRGNEHASTAIL